MGEQELIETYGVRDENGVMHLGEEVTEFDVWEQLAGDAGRLRTSAPVTSPSSSATTHVRGARRSKSGDQRFNATMLERMRKRLRNIRPQHGIIEMSNRRPVFRSTTEGEATVTIFERLRFPAVGISCRSHPMTGETQVGGTDPDYHGAFVLRAGYWDSSGKWVRAATAAREAMPLGHRPAGEGAAIHWAFSTARP